MLRGAVLIRIRTCMIETFAIVRIMNSKIAFKAIRFRGEEKLSVYPFYFKFLFITFGTGLLPNSFLYNGTA